ncbi:YycH family regulatory protein [Enterococcus columbae]|uniref:YycH family regulatory protein n=1 Tax=Enterococcus columbae TaxID=1355 RepID=UPI001FDF8092|nr:two-component system activity regulator YycH [Enterococcus columbae]
MVGLKYINRLVQIILVILIGLSFYLSYLIWLFPANQEATDVQEVSQNVVAMRSKQELFLPTQLIFRNNQATFSAHSESVIRLFQNQLAKVKLSQMSVKTYSAKAELAASYKENEVIVFHYLSQMSLSTYLQVYHLQLSTEALQKAKQLTFDTVKIDLNKEKLSFIHTDKLRVIQYDFSGLSSKNFSSLLNKTQDKMQKYPLNQEIVNGEVLSEQPIRLQLYSYISADQPYTVFRDAFFNDTKNIKVNDDTPDAISISNSKGDILTINLDTQLIDYRENNYLLKNQTLYNASAHYMANLGTSMGQLRYFTVEDERFTYRPFVEGYPIFRENNQGAIEVTFSPTVEKNQKNINITGSLTTIQVPIPSEKTQELPGAGAVYQQLFNAGLDQKQYPIITIGYQWTDLQDTGVVDLTPTWFVYYQQEWYQYQVLLKELQATN